jgi:hypothetical protein
LWILACVRRRERGPLVVPPGTGGGRRSERLTIVPIWRLRGSGIPALFTHSSPNIIPPVHFCSWLRARASIGTSSTILIPQARSTRRCPRRGHGIRLPRFVESGRVWGDDMMRLTQAQLGQSLLVRHHDHLLTLGSKHNRTSRILLVAEIRPRTVRRDCCNCRLTPSPSILALLQPASRGRDERRVACRRGRSDWR